MTTQITGTARRLRGDAARAQLRSALPGNAEYVGQRGRRALAELDELRRTLAAAIEAEPRRAAAATRLVEVTEGVIGWAWWTTWRACGLGWRTPRQHDAHTWAEADALRARARTRVAQCSVVLADDAANPIT